MLLLVLGVLAGSSVEAKIVDQAANGFTLENSEWVATIRRPAGSPSSTTWASGGLLTIAGGADASKLSISEKVGGCFCELNGARQAWHMTVTFVDPGRLMRMTGGLGPLQGMGMDGALEWRFVAENGGTRITLWYRAGGYTPDDLASFVPVVDKVQALQLGGLAEYLRTQLPSP